MELKLTAIYERAEEGGYIGYVAELPGANTQGETIEETRENLREAVTLLLECDREQTKWNVHRGEEYPYRNRQTPVR
jgi:predicted RNase H-like HicB family nuclease